MIRRRSPMVLCVAFVAACACGCQKSNPLLGKWQMTQSAYGLSIVVLREFRADGTETMDGGNPSPMDTEMTYVVDGNRLIETVTSMMMDGKRINTSSSPMAANGSNGMTESFTLVRDQLTITNSVRGVHTTQVYERVRTP